MRCKAVGLDPEATLPNELMFQEMEAVQEEKIVAHDSSSFGFGRLKSTPSV